MGSILQQTIKNIGEGRLQRFMLKVLFKKNHLNLTAFNNYNDRFYIYKVNGKFIASETINWFTNYNYLAANCSDTTLFKYKPRKGDVIVDIGAGLGEEALIISDLIGERGKVFSIEANPTVYSILNEIVERNELRNVITLNLAINSEDAPVNIIDNDETYKSGFVGNGSAKSSAVVPGFRFDSFLMKYDIQNIDLLKCNIEGAERFLVDSIDKKYLPRIRNVAIACHDFRYPENQNDFFVTKEYVKKFLAENSFEVETRNTGEDYKDDWVYGRNLQTS